MQRPRNLGCNSILVEEFDFLLNAMYVSINKLKKKTLERDKASLELYQVDVVPSCLFINNVLLFQEAGASTGFWTYIIDLNWKASTQRFTHLTDETDETNGTRLKQQNL